MRRFEARHIRTNTQFTTEFSARVVLMGREAVTPGTDASRMSSLLGRSHVPPQIGAEDGVRVRNHRRLRRSCC